MCFEYLKREKSRDRNCSFSPPSTTSLTFSHLSSSISFEYPLHTGYPGAGPAGAGAYNPYGYPPQAAYGYGRGPEGQRELRFFIFIPLSSFSSRSLFSLSFSLSPPNSKLNPLSSLRPRSLPGSCPRRPRKARSPGRRGRDAPPGPGRWLRRRGRRKLRH